MARKLTIKQEKFCHKYIETGNASEAYRQAYNAQNMTNDVIKVKAHELLKSGNVAVTVEKLKQKHAKRHEVTVDSITAELDEARRLAMMIDQPSSAVSASLGKAKLHGLVVDKKQLGSDPDNPISVVSKIVIEHVSTSK